MEEVWSHMDLFTNMYKDMMFAFWFLVIAFACCSGGELDSFVGFLLIKVG